MRFSNLLTLASLDSPSVSFPMSDGTENTNGRQADLDSSGDTLGGDKSANGTKSQFVYRVSPIKTSSTRQFLRPFTTP